MQRCEGQCGLGKQDCSLPQCVLLDGCFTIPWFVSVTCVVEFSVFVFINSKWRTEATKFSLILTYTYFFASNLGNLGESEIVWGLPY